MKYLWNIVWATIIIMLAPGFIFPKEYGVLAFLVVPVVGIEIIIIGIISFIFKSK